MKTSLLTLSIALTTVCAQAVDAPALWDKNCASCHAKDGTGNTRMGKKVDVKDYTDAKVQAAMKDDVAFKSVKEGIKEKGVDRMKPFSGKLTDEEIKALIVHIRTFKK